MDATKVSAHESWHQLEQDRYNQLLRAIESIEPGTKPTA